MTLLPAYPTATKNGWSVEELGESGLGIVPLSTWCDIAYYMATVYLRKGRQFLFLS
jgi:hypothetical protein